MGFPRASEAGHAMITLACGHEVAGVHFQDNSCASYCGPCFSDLVRREQGRLGRLKEAKEARRG